MFLSIFTEIAAYLVEICPLQVKQLFDFCIDFRQSSSKCSSLNGFGTWVQNPCKASCLSPATEQMQALNLQYYASVGGLGYGVRNH